MMSIAPTLGRLSFAAACLALLAAAAPLPGPAPEKRKGDPYPYATCVVAGTELGDDAVVIIYEGREVKTCCAQCEEKFHADPKTALAKLDAKIIKDQAKYYPLETCIVMPEETLGAGEDAEIIDYVYNNRLVRFCCKGCIRRFSKAPEKYVDQLDKAVVLKQLDSYPADVCVVGGGELGSMGEPVNIVINNRLVRLCCKGCRRSLEAQPAKYLAKLGK